MIRESLYLLATCTIFVYGTGWAEESVSAQKTPVRTQADKNEQAGTLHSLKELYIRPKDIPFPEENPYTKEKEVLGKFLYFDPRLSASGTQSCATCHNPSFGWEDGMALGTGHAHKKLGRSSPTILNLAWDHEAEAYMWDGRKTSLEDQALGPIGADVEMNMALEQLLTILKGIKGYEPYFRAAFPNDPDPITKENIAKAIATYERTVVSGEAPFDRWVNGDESAISQSAKRGFMLFNAKANCAACHSGWRFSDGSFHDIGLNDKDIGRGQHLDLPSMQHAFKTVGLRNIELRAPYMHNGSMDSLEAVVDHYNHGFVQRDSLSSEIKTLDLTDQEKLDLVAFLKTLTSEDPPATLPILPK